MRLHRLWDKEQFDDGEEVLASEQKVIESREFPLFLVKMESLDGGRK